MMASLTEQDLLLTLAALTVILLLGRGAAEVARRFHQPEVLGELLAGFVLGPSIFGALLPHIHHTLFQTSTVALVLSGISWLGVIFLLLSAGLEVDIVILRKEARPGAFAAAFVIIPSLLAGALFAWLVLGRQPPSGVFLGVVMTVTGVSVVAKILMERGALRRAYAQVILAAGVASEVVVWLMIAVMSSFHGGSPWLAFVRSAAFTIIFLIFSLTVGKRFTFWAMRRVTDATSIVHGELSLVLLLTFAAAALTQALGLHALLGAFVVGVLLTQSPRTSEPLLEGLRTLTVTMFGTVFFVLAGMRVDIFALGSVSALLMVAGLLITASVVKIGFGTIGGRLGGLRGWEAAMVGVGLNLKGGSDVVVAIVGTELGLLSRSAYTMYAVVAILTVLYSPALLRYLERKAPPTPDEEARLQREEAERRSYMPHIERVMVPVAPQLLPALAASVVERIAAAKNVQDQIFDITQVVIKHDSLERERVGIAQAKRRLVEASTLDQVEVSERKVDMSNVLEEIKEASSGYDLIAIGARPPNRDRGVLSLGELQDQIIDQTETDILVAVDGEAERVDCDAVERILVPTNGMAHSMNAGDIAGALASACNASICLFHAVKPADSDLANQEDEQTNLVQSTERVVDELEFRLSRLGIPVEKEVRVAEHVGDEVVALLEDGAYQLVVMGALDRGSDDRLYLGRSIQTVLNRSRVPVVLLIGHA